MNAVNNTYVKVLKYILFVWQVLISDCLSNRTTVIHISYCLSRKNDRGKMTFWSSVSSHANRTREIHISYCLSRSTLKERGKFTSVIVCLVSRANRTNGHLSLLLSRFTLIERGTFKFLNDLSRVMLEERQKISCDTLIERGKFTIVVLHAQYQKSWQYQNIKVDKISSSYENIKIFMIISW